MSNRSVLHVRNFLWKTIFHYTPQGQISFKSGGPARNMFVAMSPSHSKRPEKTKKKKNKKYAYGSSESVWSCDSVTFDNDAGKNDGNRRTKRKKVFICFFSFSRRDVMKSRPERCFFNAFRFKSRRWTLTSY